MLEYKYLSESLSLFLNQGFQVRFFGISLKLNPKRIDVFIQNRPVIKITFENMVNPRYEMEVQCVPFKTSPRYQNVYVPSSVTKL